MAKKSPALRVDRAAKYLEAAQINQENLWKRRQIEWRTSFSLWAAIGIASGFIYLYANRPIPSPINWIFLSTVFIVYGAIIYLQRVHLKAIFI